MIYFNISFYILAVLGNFLSDSHNKTFHVNVEAEETVYTYAPANNGASPMWTYGNTCIVRYNDKVFASGLETLNDVKPLHNTRWTLYERNEEGWKLSLADLKDRTREPSPLGLMQDGRLLLSVNPTLTKPDAYSGPAQPQILQFDVEHLSAHNKILNPVWNGNPKFTEHSYRSFAVDGQANEMILFQNIGNTHIVWSFMDAAGNWSAQGRLEWPVEDDYPDHNGAIRVCYPAVQLKDREVYFLGVSDIMEPNMVWRDYKFKLTGQKWDYDFRRLFYTYSKDITTGKFENWVEISSREKTGGWITPCDLWVAPDGLAHILWLERALDERLWEDFFPDEKQSIALNYAIIKDGEVMFRKPILTGTPEDDLIPGRGRFQITEDKRLFVFYYVQGGPSDVKENRIIEIGIKDHQFSNPIKVNLERPLSQFYSATVRGGSSPSSFMDILGKDDAHEMRYVQIKIGTGL